MLYYSFLASFTGRRVGITTGVIGKVESSAPSTLRRRNLKTQVLLFPQLPLQSILIRHENGALENALQTAGI